MSPSVTIQQPARQRAGLDPGGNSVNLISVDDVGTVAALAASDHARTITASSINISCGAIVT